MANLIPSKERVETLDSARIIFNGASKVKKEAETLRYACRKVEDEELRGAMLQKIQEALTALDAFKELSKKNKFNIIQTL